MKKIVLAILIAALAVCALVGLSACKKDSTLTIKRIELREVKNAKFKVDTEFSAANSFEVYAIMSDDSETKINNTQSLRYFKDDFANNDLMYNKATNKFKQAAAGQTFTLKVWYLSKQYEATTTFTVAAE